MKAAQPKYTLSAEPWEKASRPFGPLEAGSRVGCRLSVRSSGHGPSFHTYPDEQARTVEAGLDLTLTLLEERSEELEKSHGGKHPHSAIAQGEATPINSFLDDWIKERLRGPRQCPAPENRKARIG